MCWLLTDLLLRQRSAFAHAMAVHVQVKGTWAETETEYGYDFWCAAASYQQHGCVSDALLART